jgi:hypothetical protein
MGAVGDNTFKSDAIRECTDEREEVWIASNERLECARSGAPIGV